MPGVIVCAFNHKLNFDCAWIITVCAFKHGLITDCAWIVIAFVWQLWTSLHRRGNCECLRNICSVEHWQPDHSGHVTRAHQWTLLHNLKGFRCSFGRDWSLKKAQLQRVSGPYCMHVLFFSRLQELWDFYLKYVFDSGSMTWKIYQSSFRSSCQILYCIDLMLFR